MEQFYFRLQIRFRERERSQALKISGTSEKKQVVHTSVVARIP